MEIMEWVFENLNYKNKSGKIAIFVLYVIYFFNLLFMVLTQQKMDYGTFLVQLFFLIIITIWIYMAPYFYNDILSLKSLFTNNDEYNSEYNKMKNKIYLFKFKDNSSICKIIKLVYIIIGIVILLYELYYFYIYYECQLNFNNFFAIVLVVVSFLLNFSSYYLSLELTYLIRNISKLSNLKYNIFIPSSTYEFVKLKKNVDNASIVFLIIVVLYNLSYITLLIARTNQNNTLEILSALCFLIFSIFSCFYATVLPKYYLYQLFFNWKELSLKKFQEKLYNTMENKSSYKQIEKIVRKINRLNNDKVEFGLVSKFGTIVGLSTIIYNFIQISSLIKETINGW